MIPYERSGRRRAPAAENDNGACASLIPLQQDHLHNEPSPLTRGVASTLSYLESSGVAAWGEPTVKAQCDKMIHGLHWSLRKPFWHKCNCSMQIPQLVPLQTQFTGSARCFRLQRDMTMQFLWSAFSLSWKMNEEISIVLALWSNLVTCLGLSEIKGVSLLLCSVGTYTCCYFCQLLSKMSSASINSCKSNIHYAAIVSLFIFFRFQPFSINVLHSMYSTNTHTHALTA